MELFFTKDHEWIKVDGDEATVGITDFAQSKLGDIVYVELPETDEEVESGDAIAVVESVKAASDIFSPVDGSILEVNEELDDEPEKLNTDAMNAWIFKVKLSDLSQLEELLDDTQYQDFISEE